VNPHDVMFYDTDSPGTAVQSQRGLTHVARDPVDPLYAVQWDFELPRSHAQPLDAPGRPAAHRDFLRSHDALVGAIPNEEPRWRRRHNYYLNCLRDVDRNIATVLDREFGLSSRLLAPLVGSYVYWMLARETRRLRGGWTYEPPTFYDPKPSRS
jgi:hypothetical protein